MEKLTKVLITDTDLSLFEAFEQWEANSINSIPNFEILNFKHITDIHILSPNTTEAILIHIYPLLESYYFIKNNNSEYWLIFDPINTIKENNKKIIKKNKLLISKNNMLIRQKNALNIEINVLLIILCIILLNLIISIIAH